VEMPISYTNYGPFSSFAPQFDSTWATLDKRDSDLLISCYGDRTNAADALALRQSVQDSSENLLRVVDGILDSLTDGEHSRTIKALESPMEKKADAKQNLTIEQMTALLENVGSLENVGLDMSFVKELKVDLGLAPRPETLADKIERTGAMVNDLATLQMSRLSGQVPQTITEAAHASQLETQLGAKLAQQLSSEISQGAVQPQQFTSPPVIHQAMGINEDECDYDLLKEFFT
jgi:bromodomain-containing protein 7/9